MKKRALIAMTLAVLAVAVGVPSVWAVAEHAGPGHDQAATLAQVHKMILPMSLKSVAAIERAVAAGDRATAQRELAHLKTMLVRIQAVVAKEVGFANVTCPIMGSPIDPAKVTPNLVREYHGEKVAFCCGGCPGQWDKLSDTQKQAKLQAARGPAAHEGPAGHAH